MISGLPPYQINRRGLSRIVPGHQRVRQHDACGRTCAAPCCGRPAIITRSGRTSTICRRCASARRRSLDDIGLASRRDVPAGLLTYAEQRALEIGITIAGGADVILLDEPTAGMSHAETERAVALIRRLTEGRTLVIVEHDMSVVFGLADRISVLVYGHIIASGTPDEIRVRSEGQGSLSRRGGCLMLEVKDLHAYYGKSHILQGVDLRHRRRRGREPAGPQRRRPLDHRQGDHGRGAAAGHDPLQGDRTSPGLPSYRIAHLGLGYVPEHRDIFPGLTVRQNLMLGIKDPAQARQMAARRHAARCSPISPRAPIPPPACMSGGEKQMLTICRTLMGDPELIMIDEPTEGLAPLIVQQVGDLIAEIARRGVAILLVEQKLSIAMRISHRVYVMGHGRIVFEGTPAELTTNAAVRKEWLEV